MASFATRFLAAALAKGNLAEYLKFGKMEHVFALDPGAADAFQFVKHYIEKEGALPPSHLVEAETQLALPVEDVGLNWLYEKAFDTYIQRSLKIAVKEANELFDQPLEALSSLAAAIDAVRLAQLGPKIVDFKNAYSESLPKMVQKWAMMDSAAKFGWPYMDQQSGGIWPGDLISLVGRPGLGKEQPVSEPVLMADGAWKAMGDLKVGDAVASVDGAASHVTAVYPQGVKPIWTLTFADGRTTRAGADHLWEVHYRAWAAPRLLKTTDLIDLLKRKRYANRLSVSLISGEFGAAASRPVDPYVLGVLLGDGCLTRDLFFTTMDDDIVQMVEKALPYGSYCQPQACTSGGKARNWSITTFEGKGHSNPTKDALKAWGLIGKTSLTKFIPDECFRWPRAERLALLQGLLDTDGTVGAGNCVQFSSSSPRLAQDVRKLVWSLGGCCPMRTKKTTHEDHHVLTVRMSSTENLFRCQRKASKFKPSQYAARLKNVLATITPAEAEEAQCISVSHPRHLYVTRDYVVTHNTWLMLWVALNVWKITGQPVVFVSMEIMAQQIVERLSALYTGTAMDFFKTGMAPTLFTGDKKMPTKKKVQTMLKELEGSDMPPFIVVDGNLTAAVSDVVSVVQQFKPGAVFIDGAYMLQNGQTKSMYEAVAVNCNLLKQRVATDLGCPTFCSWQFSRELEKLKKGQKPGLEHIGYSDVIGQASTIVLGLFQDDDQSNVESLYQRKISVLKGRNGEVGEFLVHWSFKDMVFSEIDKSAIAAAEIAFFD